MFGKKDRVNYNFKLFDCELNEAKSRISSRDYGYDFHNRFFDDITTDTFLAKKTDYINKQFADYQTIKEHLLKNNPNQII